MLKGWLWLSMIWVCDLFTSTKTKEVVEYDYVPEYIERGTTGCDKCAIKQNCLSDYSNALRTVHGECVFTDKPFYFKRIKQTKIK